MEQFVFFTDDPNHVTGLEGCVRGGVHGGGAVAFDADDETGGFITDAGFPDGVSHEWCVGLNGELFQADFRGTLLFKFMFPFFYAVFDKLTEDVDFFVRGGHDDVIERIQAFFPTRDVYSFFSPDDCYHADPTGLAEIQFL